MSYLTALNRTVEEYESYYGILGYHKVYVGKKGSYKRYNRVNRFYHVPVVKLTQSTKLAYLLQTRNMSSQQSE